MKLADTPALGAGSRKGVKVQVLSRARVIIEIKGDCSLQKEEVMWDAIGIFGLIFFGFIVAMYFIIDSFDRRSFVQKLALRFAAAILLYEIYISLHPLF